MIQTAITIKRLGVLAAKWEVVPASSSSTAQRNAAFIQQQFDKMEGSPTALLSQAMDAFTKGWSVQELILESNGDQIHLVAARAKDPSRFGLEVDSFGRTTGLNLEILGEPAKALPTDKFVIYRNRGGYAKPKGHSDLDAAHQHWMAKRTLLTSWETHLRRYASPTVMASANSTVSRTDLEAMRAALDGIADRRSVLYPDGIQVNTLGGSKEASSGFMEAIEFHNREIARAILGQTLTTDEGRRVGSLALGKVHLQVLLLQLRAIRQELADEVMAEQVIRPLIEWNFGPSEIPIFKFEEANLDTFGNL
jgi:phage gp29-like protein